MATVRIALAALALLAATPAEAESVDRWRPYIAEASVRYGIPVEWIEGVMRAESGGRTTLNGPPIVSRAGAMGGSGEPTSEPQSLMGNWYAGVCLQQQIEHNL